LATKHLAAIIAAYGTYQMMSQSGNEGWGKLLAIAEYTAASHLIGKSESADTRFWSTLPQNFYWQNIAVDSSLADTTNFSVSIGKKASDGTFMPLSNQNRSFADLKKSGLIKIGL
jgi:hypothetical protein